MFISSYEFVTYSVHSQKVTRFLGNGFEFLANANNMAIHGAGGREILVAPDLVEKALAAQRLSGVTEKVLEQLKLLRISGSPLLSTRRTACGAPRPFSKSRHGQRRHHPTPNCAA
jgi:hypothetical protein